jgi:hypothetical protein
VLRAEDLAAGEVDLLLLDLERLAGEGLLDRVAERLRPLHPHRVGPEPALQRDALADPRSIDLGAPVSMLPS